MHPTTGQPVLVGTANVSGCAGPGLVLSRAEGRRVETNWDRQPHLPAGTNPMILQTPLRGPVPCGSYLYQPAFCIDDALRCPAEAYVPQPGDIMLRLDGSRFWRVTHYLALAFDPNGSGIVFARHDGSLAVLEAGP